jgi:hypothetical protein
MLILCGVLAEMQTENICNTSKIHKRLIQTVIVYFICGYRCFGIIYPYILRIYLWTTTFRVGH